MSGSGLRLPVVKVNPDQELAKAESRLNGLLAGLSEDLREASVDQASIHSEGSRGSSGSVGGGFGPCARCRNVITCEAEGCNALGENFHSSCFHCNRCGTQLVSKAFVHSNNRVYCSDCYKNREVSHVPPSCSVCFKPIVDEICIAMGRRFHTYCFVCSVCQKPLAGQEFRLGPGPDMELLCLTDWGLRYAPRCGGCGDPILPPPDSDRIECYQLANSNQPQSNSFFHFNCFSPM